mgnify:FL=1
MSYAQYGLTATDAKSADHDKGIVKAPDGSFYQIDGFKREQNDDLDTDQGKVFSSALQADAKSANDAYDPSTFNTATDVENALRQLDGGGETEATPDKNIKLSPRLATARARAAQFEEDRVSGQMSKDLYDSDNHSAEGFLERYKLKLGERLENGNFLTPDASATNSSKVGSGENDVSLDASEYSRTGKDNRKDY